MLYKKLLALEENYTTPLGDRSSCRQLGLLKAFLSLFTLVCMFPHYLCRTCRQMLGSLQRKFLGGRYFAVSHCRRMHVNTGEGMKIQRLLRVNVGRYKE